LCRNSPGEENRDLTGKYVLKGQVEAGFSRSMPALAGREMEIRRLVFG
jgi:hypothetical protein